MQQAGQVPHLDQNDAHKQSLGQSDGSLPGPEQTVNKSINECGARGDGFMFMSGPFPAGHLCNGIQISGCCAI